MYLILYYVGTDDVVIKLYEYVTTCAVLKISAN